MSNISISNILYLSFRLAPFIIVSYFTLQSLLNWDLKGVVYLVGLLCACVITVMVSKTAIDIKLPSGPEDLPSPKCNIITLGEGGALLSNIPLSITIFSYTLFYLLIFILNLANLHNSNKGILESSEITQENINVVLQQNVPVFVLFPLLIIVESIWLVMNRCIQTEFIMLPVILSIFIGGAIGVLWGVIITSLENPSLQYINKAGLEVCKQPSKTLYRCRPTNTSGQNL